MRLDRLYKRFANQYRIHYPQLSLWAILRIAWIQSRHKKCKTHAYSRDEDSREAREQ